MSVAGLESLAPRPSAKPLAWALLISLAIHLTAFVVVPMLYIALVRLNIIPKPRDAAHLQPRQNIPPQVSEVLPLTFLEVDPSQAVKEPPKNAKYYSSRNSLAANPDPKLDTQTPKIDGKQTLVPRTETVEKPKSFPLMPAPKPPPPAPEKADEAKEESKPKAAPKVGDLAMAKPADKPQDKPADAQTEEAPPKHVRPRTLAEAEAQNRKIVGQQMKQDGGVRRSRIVPSENTIITGFGEYDAMFIAAVQQHWYDLIDAHGPSALGTGRVVLSFSLNYNGTISDMKVIDSDVDRLMIYMCQQAVLDPQPFEKWPSDMRRIIGSDHREVRFTFYYQ